MSLMQVCRPGTKRMVINFLSIQFSYFVHIGRSIPFARKNNYIFLTYGSDLSVNCLIPKKNWWSCTCTNDSYMCIKASNCNTWYMWNYWCNQSSCSNVQYLKLEQLIRQIVFRMLVWHNSLHTNPLDKSETIITKLFTFSLEISHRQAGKETLY